MSGSPKDDAPYEIIPSEDVWREIEKLPESAQEKIFALWRDQLRHTPTKRIPGKLKELKGEYKGLYQYEVTGSERMVFSVDEAERKVYIEYVGKHPDWSRRRKRPF